jgi:putative ABC transport system permease protein
LPALLRLALRNVIRQGSRSAIALVAIALGVAAIIVAGGFVHDVYIQLGESIIHSSYGHLQAYRKGYAAYGTQRPTDYLIEEPDEVIRRVRELTGVDIVLSRLRFTGLANAGGGDWPIAGEGVEPKLENRLGTYIQLVEGRLLSEDDHYAVIVGDGVAKALHVSAGKSMSINTATPEGALNSLEFEVVGVFRSYSKEFDQRAIRLPLAAAQELLAVRGINEVVVTLADTAATDRAASALRDRLGSADYEVRTWRDLADFYAKTVRLFDRQFGFMQVVLLLMIVLSVANTINTAAFERLPEFGTMLALGDRRGDVFRLIMVECFVLGILGSAVGVAIGLALAVAISAVGIPMPPPPNADLGYVALIRIVPEVILGAFAVGTVSAALAGVLPSFKIARTAPAEALRRAL